MFRALRPYLNAFLIGFILTFVIYLFIRFNASDIVLGMVIAAVGGAALLVVYIYLDRKFGRPEVVYDRDGNPVRR
jgi:multisubunit Na+/H+ antiporter MnhC subunit